MIDFSLITTDELIKELESRCDNGVIILEADHRADDSGLAMFWSGNGFACLGLLDFMRSRIRSDIRDGTYPKDEL